MVPRKVSNIFDSNEMYVHVIVLKSIQIMKYYRFYLHIDILYRIGNMLQSRNMNLSLFTNDNHWLAIKSDYIFNPLMQKLAESSQAIFAK